MIEADWLCCTNPTLMFEHLRDTASDRKLRLAGVAFCRSIWHLIPNDVCRTLVEVSERYADGLATDADLEAADIAHGRSFFDKPFPYSECSAHAAYEAVGQLGRHNDGYYAQRRKVEMRRPNLARYAWEAALCASLEASAAFAGENDWLAGAPERARHCDLIRDIFGNPFRPPVPLLLPTDVVALAESIYTGRLFEQMPQLAASLDAAGCSDPEILSHCHCPGPHVRGCLVVDLILGRK